jgi:N-acetylmuramoyl-L-alanine amidase
VTLWQKPVMAVRGVFVGGKPLGKLGMIEVRQGARVLFILALLLCADRHAAQGEDHGVAAKTAPAACEHADFRVVIDVGHTVTVPGAISARGVPEYVFNLQLGQDAKQAMLDAGFAKTVLLITGTAPPKGLFERAFRANNMAADLFIAIHHDSVPDYLLQTWQYDGKDEYFNDSFPGYAIFISNENADPADSLMFGRFLGEQLQARGLGYTPHYILPLMRNRRRELVDADAGVYRYDQLIVLQRTHMPAVLLEAGSIVNRQEELALAAPERRALESAAIVAAVEEFCTARANRHSEPHVKRPTASNGATQAHKLSLFPFVR